VGVQQAIRRERHWLGIVRDESRRRGVTGSGGGARPPAAAAAPVRRSAVAPAREKGEARPRRGCRAGKEKQLKVARKEMLDARLWGDADRISDAQAALSARKAACRGGEAGEAEAARGESGPGRRARGGGSGRRPRAAHNTGLVKRRKKFKRGEKRIARIERLLERLGEQQLESGRGRERAGHRGRGRAGHRRHDRPR